MSAATASDPGSDQRGGHLSEVTGSDSVDNMMLEHLLEMLGPEEFRRVLEEHAGAETGEEDISMSDATDTTAFSSSTIPELYTEKVFDSACRTHPRKQPAASTFTSLLSRAVLCPRSKAYTNPE